jgi:broad specificity phosphatase PhoE
MRVILTRHGETLENIEGRFQGHLPGTLSDLGIEQAKKLALRLRNEKIDLIISSDLARSADTAKEIANYHNNTTFELSADMRERSLGELEGVKKTDLGLDKNKLVAGTVETKNGETQLEMYERAKNFINRLKKNHTNKTILLVGHNGINMAIIANILDKTFQEYKMIEPQNNCALTIFNINDKKTAEIKLWNDTRHLKYANC